MCTLPSRPGVPIALPRMRVWWSGGRLLEAKGLPEVGPLLCLFYILRSDNWIMAVPVIKAQSLCNSADSGYSWLYPSKRKGRLIYYPWQGEVWLLPWCWNSSGSWAKPFQPRTCPRRGGVCLGVQNKHHYVWERIPASLGDNPTTLRSRASLCCVFGSLLFLNARESVCMLLFY